MASQQAISSGTNQDEQIKSHYRTYIDYCNAQDYKSVEEFYTSPININDESCPSSKAIDRFKSLVEAFPDWRWEIRRLTLDGEYLAVHFDITATHQGTFQGIQATGRRIKTTELTLYRVADGKFSHVWPFIDFASIIEQIS
jgi:predicted ester cyclase